MQGQALPGFRDFYPAEAALRNQIFGVWRAVATRYGFEEYDGPPLEPLELYTEKSGDEIVGQLYEFEDKGGRRVALRPEMTPSLARMVAARASALKKPIRWFAIPQLFRYERQQRGRLREHFQFNMDLIGESGPLADAEIAAAAVDVMRGFGLGPDAVRLRLSDRRVVSALLRHAGVPEAVLPAAYAAIDKIEREPADVLAERLVKAGLPASVADGVLAAGRIRGRPALDAALAPLGGSDVAEDLYSAADALAHMGLGAFVDLDLSIVRGLAYYTGIVFELFDAGRSLRAICGGGRYDGLLRALGGVDLPAVGFGMGDVVLGELIRGTRTSSSDAPPVDLFLVAVGSDDVPFVLALAHRLRDSGRRVEYALKTQGLGKQLKLAAARAAPRALIVGPDERARGVALLRNLVDGTETPVALDQVEHALGNT
jgi:histidyl-tRNA synthetase